MKIKGTKGNDVLRGTDGNDVIKGGRGDDYIAGRDGIDILKGGKGRDTFVIAVDQFDLIKDCRPGKDKIVLVDDALSMDDNGPGRVPLDPSDFGTLVTLANGVIEYDGAPVVAVGDVGLTYADLWLS